MKRLLLIFFGSLVLSDITFAQKTGQNKNDYNHDAVKDKSQKIAIADRRFIWSVGGLYNYYEGPGWNLTMNFRHIACALPDWQNVYLGLEITKNAELGFEVGIKPKLKEWNKVRLSEKIGIVFHDRNIVFTPHDSLVSETLGKQRKMVFALQLGLNLEIATRVGFFATFNPGVSLYPDSKFNWGHNGYYYWGCEGGLYFLFGGIKYPKPNVKMPD